MGNLKKDNISALDITLNDSFRIEIVLLCTLQTTYCPENRAMQFRKLESSNGLGCSSGVDFAIWTACFLPGPLKCLLGCQ